MKTLIVVCSTVVVYENGQKKAFDSYNTVSRILPPIDRCSMNDALLVLMISNLNSHTQTRSKCMVLFVHSVSSALLVLWMGRFGV